MKNLKSIGLASAFAFAVVAAFAFKTSDNHTRSTATVYFSSESCATAHTCSDNSANAVCSSQGSSDIKHDTGCTTAESTFIYKP